MLDGMDTPFSMIWLLCIACLNQNIWGTLYIHTPTMYPQKLKIQKLFLKNSQQTKYGKNIPQHNKGHIWQTSSEHHTQRWKLESFLSNIRNKIGMSNLTTSIHIVLEVLARTLTQEKEIKGI